MTSPRTGEGVVPVSAAMPSPSLDLVRMIQPSLDLREGCTPSLWLAKVSRLSLTLGEGYDTLAVVDEGIGLEL